MGEKIECCRTNSLCTILFGDHQPGFQQIYCADSGESLKYGVDKKRLPEIFPAAFPLAPYVFLSFGRL